MNPIKLLIAAGAYVFWPLLAIGVAVACRAFFEALADMLFPRKAQSRNVVITTDEPGQITILRPHGIVEFWPARMAEMLTVEQVGERQ